ncbi:MAG: ParB/RepB/Spo0J family partition protein [Nitrososphaerota archaeon]|nr:ParB/RepB/Spo0J family partition protein [Nitrososphaerota archaeon]
MPHKRLRLEEIEVDKIDQGKFKNRLGIDGIRDLAESIRNQGLLVPLFVRRMANGKVKKPFELVSGHRRFAAIKKLGVKSASCIILEGSDEKMIEYSIVENVQREDLTDYEKASTFRLLNEQYGMTYEQIGNAIGKSKQYVSNHIAMLKIRDELRIETERNMASQLLQELTEHHTRVLLRIRDARRRLEIAEFAVRNRLNVRQLGILADRESPNHVQPASEQTSIPTPARTDGEKYVVVLDSSAEGTVCRIYECMNGATVAEHSFVPSNFHICGAHGAASIIAEGLRGSLIAAGIGTGQISTVAICMSSVHTPADMRMMSKAFAKLGVFGTVFIDRYVAAFISATNDKPGIVVSTGFGGSGVFGKNSLGQVSKSGGWGYMIDPSGSAYSIGLEALKSLSQAFDDPKNMSNLAKRTASYLNVKTYDQLHALAYQKSLQMMEIAKLSQVVVSAAKSGDHFARQILIRTATDLERLSLITLGSLSAQDDSKFDVILTGSILKPDGFTYDVLRRSLLTDERVRVVSFRDLDILGAAFNISMNRDLSRFRNQLLTKLASEPSQKIKESLLHVSNVLY